MNYYTVKYFETVCLANCEKMANNQCSGVHHNLMWWLGSSYVHCIPTFTQMPFEYMHVIRLISGKINVENLSSKN